MHGFAYDLSKKLKLFKEKLSLLIAAAHKRLFLKKLFVDVMGKIEGKISPQELKALLSALSFLGVELSKEDLEMLNGEMKRVFEEGISPKVLIDYLFLVIRASEEGVTAEIPEIKNYLQTISKWSASRTLIDPKGCNYEASYRCRKSSHYLLRKAKIQIDDINLYPLAMKKNNYAKDRSVLSFSFFYDQIALDRSKDAGLREYAAAMKNYYASDMSECSYLLGHVYDDLDYAGSSAVKQWAVLVEHNLLPADKELYNDCHALFRRKRNLVRTMQRQLGEQPKSEPVAFLDNTSICRKTGWMFENNKEMIKEMLQAKKNAANGQNTDESINVKNTVVMLELERDTYTVIEKGKAKKKLLGIESVAKRQLENIGGYNVINASVVIRDP